jgi:NADH-quinone oxidoreductase subunit M
METAALTTGAAGKSILDFLSNPINQVLAWPLIGCLLICLMPRTRVPAIRLTALAATILSAMASFLMLSGVPKDLRDQGLAVFGSEWYPLAEYEAFVPEIGTQFEQRISWMAIKFGEMQSFGVNYHVGVDGLSMPLVLLSTVIFLLVIIWSWKRTDRIKEFLALTLFMQTGIIGSFVALDYVLLYLFWEWMLIPMFFLVAGWGRDQEKARRAAIRFFVYTLFGSVFLLIAIIALQVMSAGSSSAVYSFSIIDLTISYVGGGAQSLHVAVRLLIFLGLLMGFAVKAPMWPFHGWLPDAHSEAPTEMSVILAALMLKTGSYAFLRCLYATFPDIAYHLGPVIAACGLIAIVYGAAITLLQTDLKRMVAWSSISHMGFIMLGISAMNPHSTMGAMFHMVAHGIVIALLFFLVGWIEDHYGTRDIRELGGLFQYRPLAGGLLALGAFAGMGFPGLIAFWGELLVLQGTFFNNPSWYTVMIHDPLTVIRFIGTILSGPDGFYNSEMWYGPDVAVGMSGARFLQICAVLAVFGVLTSAIYMLNMLQKVVLGPVQTMPALAGGVPKAIAATGSISSAEPAGTGEAGAGTDPAHKMPPALDLPSDAAARSARRALQLFGLEWNYALVLLPLGIATVWLGLQPGPLLDMGRRWAEALALTQVRF